MHTMRVCVVRVRWLWQVGERLGSRGMGLRGVGLAFHPHTAPAPHRLNKKKHVMWYTITVILLNVSNAQFAYNLVIITSIQAMTI